MSIGAFVANLAARIERLEQTLSAGSRDPIWLGGLIQPEAFVTATRQAVAQQKGWSLEQLVLEFRVGEPNAAEAFAIDGEWIMSSDNSVLMGVGIKLDGAVWTPNGLKFNDGSSTTLSDCQLSWRKAASGASPAGQVSLPVYLNGDRTEVLFAVQLDAVGASQAELLQRGVCLTAA